MKKTIDLSPQTISLNIQNLQKFMQQHDLDGMYISSFDIYLNEYVPLADNHRFYFTGFTGSVAEALVPRTGKVHLYVDGRYHEQADSEVPLDVVHVVKCDASTGNHQALIQDILQLKLKKVGVEAERCALSFFKRLSSVSEVKAFQNGEVAKLLTKSALDAPKEIKLVSREHRGRDTLEKTRMAFSSDKEAMFIAALDQIAWITNCRGYHLPFLSSFRAKALATLKKVYVFVEHETPLHKSAEKIEGVEWIKVSASELKHELEKIQNTLHLDSIQFDSAHLNCADFNTLMSVFHTDRLKEKPAGLIEWMSIKEPIEIKEMEDNFRRSDKAIFNTIKWVKEKTSKGERITELDLWQETTLKYREQGAIDQSFNTIAGVGPNGSIIHYGNPSDEVVIKNTDMILLDSGGYYEGGFATDTTRTFFASFKGQANPEYKKIYTLVLKGLLNCQFSVFPVGTKGNVLDGMARAPLFKHGYNYNHGTGHGVGVHVHEDGVRLSMISQMPMKEGQVVSIEPGIYIPGFAGVRLENVAVVEKHPTLKGMLCFRSLTNVGFDPELIDDSLMNSEEMVQLKVYESECLKRGNSLMKLA